MPLASSLSASQKRAAIAEMERREQERRCRVTQGRGGSTRRMSLPSALHTTTNSNSTNQNSNDTSGSVVVSIARVEKLRSLRRQHNSSSLQKNKKRHSISGNSAHPYHNDNDTKENSFSRHYSPPVTRSAKKKKLSANVLIDGNAPATAVFLFSPPNQVANERSEQERVQRKELERKEQIEQARRNGRMFVVPLHPATSSVNEVATEAMAAAEAKLTEIQTAHSALAASHFDLQENLAKYESRIALLESDIVPTLESNLETERDMVARLEAEVETRLGELDDSRQILARLEEQIQDVQRQTDEERKSYEQRIDESKATLEQMAIAMAEKESLMTILTARMETCQNEIVESSESLEVAQVAMAKQTKLLNDALDDTLTQLDRAEEEKKELQIKLEETTNLLQIAKTTVATKEAEHDAAIEDLTKQLDQAREQMSLLHAETYSSGTDKDQELQKVRLQLIAVMAERDLARSNMQSFHDREADLQQKLRDGSDIRREMHNRLMQLMGNIRVFVRVRPVLEREQVVAAIDEGSNISTECQKKRKREDDAVSPFTFPENVTGSRDMSIKHQRSHASTIEDDLTKNVVDVLEPFKDRGGLQDRRKKWRFGFDRVFSPDHGQEDVWEATKPLVQCVVDGSHVTIFAYGQTGSGKTHTMLGESGKAGLIGRSVQMLFDEKRELEQLSNGETRVSVTVELLEVYNEKIRDLLSAETNQDLKVVANDVVGNCTVETESFAAVMEVLELAQNRRCVKATNSNAESSRSHMIFTLHFCVATTSDGKRRGKLNICDLAGSERLDKSRANIFGGALLEESKSINKSLSVLSNVIERLQTNDANVPYRESKLTMLLKNSLCGKNSKTLAIACCNPLPGNFQESLSTLRFAEKVNRVELKATSSFTA